MRTLIIDDEEPARSRLRRLLRKHPEVVVEGEAGDGLEALRLIEAVTPDLLFLDIEMPGLGGFELLRSIPPDLAKPLVIFVTGYDQHALAAFDANALAYLLKPVEPERLARAVERAGQLGNKEGERILRIAREAPQVLRQIACRKRDRVVLIVPAQILWFEVADGIVKAHTADDTFWVN